MSISITTLQIFFILTPGIIFSGIVFKYLDQDEITNKFNFLIRTILSSGVSYALYQSFYRQNLSVLEFLSSSNIENFNAVSKEVIITSVISFIMALAFIFFSNRKLFLKFLELTKISRVGFRKSDVWQNFLEQKIDELKKNCYVGIFDYSKELIYYGTLQKISSSEKLREVVLYNVEIYDFYGNLHKKTEDYIYFSGQSDKIHIEFFNNNLKPNSNDGNK